MNPDRAQKTIWAFVAALLLAGVGLSVQTAGKIRDTRVRVERKLHDLEKLRAIESRVRRGEAARQAVESMPRRSVEPLLPLVQASFGVVKDEDCRETRRDLVPGWIVRQTEISFNEVPFADVMELIHKAEAFQPPWRLAKCTLRAAPGLPGAGQAVLQLEAVQRRE